MSVVLTATLGLNAGNWEQCSKATLETGENIEMATKYIKAGSDKDVAIYAKRINISLKIFKKECYGVLEEARYNQLKNGGDLLITMYRQQGYLN